MFFCLLFLFGLEVESSENSRDVNGENMKSVEMELLTCQVRRQIFVFIVSLLEHLVGLQIYHLSNILR